MPKAQAILPYTPEKIAQIRGWVADCQTWLEARDIIAKRLGIEPDNATRMNRKHGLWRGASAGGSTSEAATTTGGFDVEVETSIPKTVDEVVGLCKVDLGKWEPKGFTVRRGAKGFAWNARFAAKTLPVDVDALLKRFLSEARGHAPKAFKLPSVVVRGGRLLEISVMDSHFAKLCWGIETRGPDYDLKIATRDFKEAVYGLAAHAKANGVERILMPVGNDILNSDNLRGTTTAGTDQATSEDGRWQKAYTTVCATVSEVIETLAANYGVDVVICSGNHDKERCYYLGEYLRAWFRNHPGVAIDNSPAQRKYHRFGTVLLGFTHGNEEKQSDLPLLMASECKKDWAETTIREIHVGHLHQEKVTEKMGVKTRVISSLVPQDEWSTSKGYVGNVRLAEAFLYDRERGLLANYYHNV